LLDGEAAALAALGPVGLCRNRGRRDGQRHNGMRWPA
jgi:hypothetical protein